MSQFGIKDGDMCRLGNRGRACFFATQAKRELNGKKSGEGGNHVTVVRFAANATAVKVTGLSPTVTNELLAKAFSVFGPIERCLVYVDCHGRSKEEGIVEV